MEKENKDMLLAGVLAIAIFLIWFFSNTLGCSTKVRVPDSCLDDENWFVIEMCKSRNEICYETDFGVDCVERF